MAPCSHTFHYKCLRPLLANHPGFQCPLCRNYADLDASVSIEVDEVSCFILPFQVSSTHIFIGQDNAEDNGRTKSPIITRYEDMNEPIGTLLMKKNILVEPIVTANNENNPATFRLVPQPGPTASIPSSSQIST